MFQVSIKCSDISLWIDSYPAELAKEKSEGEFPEKIKISRLTLLLFLRANYTGRVFFLLSILFVTSLPPAVFMALLTSLFVTPEIHLSFCSIRQTHILSMLQPHYMGPLFAARIVQELHSYKYIWKPDA